jgi:pSer/pThr/pTyr-binding forkhead associated (FHA) protein
VPSLILVRGFREGERHPLAPPGIFLGRETDNDLQLPVDGVSRYHAKVTEESGVWRVVDLNSSNGIKVNGERVPEKILTDGDLIYLGKVVLRFVADPLPEKPTEAAAAPVSVPLGSAETKPLPLPPAVADEPSRRRFRERDKEIQRLIQLALTEKRRRLRRIAILLAIVANLLVLAGFIFFRVMAK